MLNPEPNGRSVQIAQHRRPLVTVALRLVDVRAKLLLLFAQARLLLPAHALAREDHHERLVPLLLAVRAAARRLLLLLALERAVLLAALTALLDRGHALRVVGLGLLPRPEDVVLGDEGVGEVAVRRGKEGLLLRLERGELALRGAATPTFNCGRGGFDPKVVEKSEVCWCENL